MNLRVPSSLCLLTLVLLACSACDNVPTFQELTGQEESADAPDPNAPDPNLQPSDPPAMPAPPAPVVKTPQQIVDAFLATDPRFRNDKHLEELAALEPAALQQLTTLDLKNSQVRDDGAAHLEKFPALEALDISGTAITVDGITSVSKSASLTRLQMDRMPLIDSKALAPLENHAQLIELSLNGTPIADDAFQYFKNMQNLEVLRFSGMRSLQGHGFRELLNKRGLPKLKELEANGTGFGYYGLKDLKGSPTLEILRVRDAQISDDAIVGISNCRSLKELDLSQNPIGNNALKLLAKLKQLETLHLVNCNGLDDRGLGLLRGMKQLKHLHLGGNRLSESAVQELKTKFLKETTITFGGKEY